MPQSHYVPGILQQVFVNVLAENDLFTDLNSRIEIDFQFARAFRPASQLHP
jgi:hypothetical protein